MTQKDHPQEDRHEGMSRRRFLKLMGGAAGLTAAQIAGVSGITGMLLSHVAPAAAQSTVELWTGFGQGRMSDAMAGAIARFEEENPDYTIDHIIVPWGEIRNRVIAAVAAGTPPSSYRGGAPMVGDAAIGALTNLQPYVDANDIDLEDFWPDTRGQMQFNGEVYALSISTIVRFLYYNKDRMAEAGLDPDSPPTTIAELDAMAAAMQETNDRGEIERLGFAPTVPEVQPFQWAAAFGSNFFDEEEGNIAVDEDAMLAMFEWYQSYANQLGAENLQAFASTYGGNQFGRNTPQGIYYTGLVGFWGYGSWAYNDMGEYGPDVDFGVVPLPTLEGAENASPGTSIGNMYFVPANAPNEAGGFAFANFMSSSPWVAVNKALVDSVTPSRLSLASLPEVEAASEWITLARDEILPRVRPNPAFAAAGFFEATLIDSIEEIMFNGVDPAEALEDAIRRSRREYERITS